MFRLWLPAILVLLCGQIPARAEDFAEIQEALKRGEIHWRLREEWRLVPEDAAASKTFQTQVEALAKRLFPERDFVKQPIRFILSDTNDRNAAYVSGLEPPHILVTTGLLRSLKTVDQLAWLIGHEITHADLEKKLGKHHNSKGEELLADLTPLRRMLDAGLDPREGLTALKSLAVADPKIDPNEAWETRWKIRGILNDHPTDLIRQRLMQNALAELHRERGDYRVTSTALPNEVRTVADQAKHESYVDKYLREKNYAAQEPVVRARLLTELMTSTPNWTTARLQSLASAVWTLKRSWPSQSYAPVEGQAVAAMVDAFLDVSKRTNIHPDWVTWLYEFIQQLRPDERSGRLAQVALAYKEFQQASGPARLERAHALLRALDAEGPGADRLLRKYFPLAGVELPKDGEDSEHAIAEVVLRLTSDSKEFTLAEQQLSPKQRLRLALRLNTETSWETKQSMMSRSLDSVIALAAAGDEQARRLLEEAREPWGQLADRHVGWKHLEWNPGLILDLNVRNPMPEMTDNKEPWEEVRERLHRDHRRIEAEEGKLFRRLENLYWQDPNKYRDAIRRYYLEVLAAQNRSLDHMDQSIAFFISAPGSLFTWEEKQKFFDRFLYRFMSASADRPKVLERLRAVSTTRPPKTGPELLACLQELLERNSPFRQLQAELEVRAFFERYPHASIDAVALAKLAGPLINQKLINDPIREILRQRRPGIAWSDKPEIAVDQWATLAQHDLFDRSSPDQFERLRRILDQLDRLPPAKRLPLLERLILSGFRIEDPSLRERAFESWARTQREGQGKDDRSDAYRERALAVASEVRARAHQADSTDLLERLSRELEAQGPLARAVGELAGGYTREELESTQIKGVVGEVMEECLAHEPTLRADLMNYLAGRATDTATRRIRNALEKAGRKHRRLLMEKNWPDSATVEAELLNSHRNFWAASFPVRTAVFQEILLPAKQKPLTVPSWRRWLSPIIGKPRDSRFDAAFEQVVSLALPTDSPYFAETRRILRTYLDIVPDYQRGLFLSAVLAAKEQTKGELRSPGSFLATTLSYLGPAEKKIAQAIHSHPSTPADLRADMAQTKSWTDIPPRWEVMRLYDALPAELRGKVKGVHEVIGAASYWVVVRVTLQNGQEAALALQRPFARERSEEGFARVEELGRRLGGPLGRDLTTIVGQARQANRSELDPVAEHRRNEMARAFYEGLAVELDGQRITFRTAGLQANGEGFRLMDLAKGTHFNDLPEATPAEKARKKNWAMATVYVELSALLAGLATDSDRHGAQNKIEGDVMTLFDFGAMRLAAPSRAEREKLGALLFEAWTKASQTGRPFEEVLIELLQEAQRRGGGSSEYLGHVQRSLLALNDYFKYLDRKDVERIIGAIRSSDSVHKDFESGMRRQGIWQYAASLLRLRKPAKPAPFPFCPGAFRMILPHH